jgi:hypothetical protein
MCTNGSANLVVGNPFILESSLISSMPNDIDSKDNGGDNNVSNLAAIGPRSL